MGNCRVDPLDRFAYAAEQFCVWACKEDAADEDDLARVCQLLADLVAGGCSLGWNGGEPSQLECEAADLELVKARAAELPFQYYAEVFNNLVLPAEEPVTGDLIDDLIDIYRDIAPGLALYRAGKRREASDHWRFWFANHWGEHATSALRASWSFLAGREGSDAWE